MLQQFSKTGAQTFYDENNGFLSKELSIHAYSIRDVDCDRSKLIITYAPW